MTTIKVRTATRDRINAVGARTHETADQVVSRALDEYERSTFWAQYAAAAAAAAAVAADPVAMAEESTEADRWDRAVRDGVPGD